MHKIIILLFPLLLCASEWKAFKTLDQIKIYEKYEKEVEFVQFRAVTKMPFSLDWISKTIMDHDSYTSWLSDCIKAEKSNDKIYLLMQPPWPLSRRQVWVEIEKNEYVKKQIITLRSLNIQASSSDAVWFNDLYVAFILEELGRSETKVTLSLLGDIGGSVPHWLVNLMAWKIPYNSLLDLKKQLLLNKNRQHHHHRIQH